MLVMCWSLASKRAQNIELNQTVLIENESSYKNVSKRFSDYAVLYISGTEYYLIVSQVKRFNTENPQSQYNRKVNDHLNTAFRRI